MARFAIGVLCSGGELWRFPGQLRCLGTGLWPFHKTRLPHRGLWPTLFSPSGSAQWIKAQRQVSQTAWRAPTSRARPPDTGFYTVSGAILGRHCRPAQLHSPERRSTSTFRPVNLSKCSGEPQTRSSARSLQQRLPWEPNCQRDKTWHWQLH